MKSDKNSHSGLCSSTPTGGVLAKYCDRDAPRLSAPPVALRILNTNDVRLDLNKLEKELA